MTKNGILFKRFLHNPYQVGAIAESGEVLCRELVSRVDFRCISALAELGPGTGAVTRVILQQCPAGVRFFAVELDSEICKVLRAELPDLTVYNCSAADLPDICCRCEKIVYLDAIISGLPWAVFTHALQQQLLESIYQVLIPGGMFVTFAYCQGLWLPGGRRFRKLLQNKFSSVSVSRTIWRNLPPAVVYCCQK